VSSSTPICSATRSQQQRGAAVCTAELEAALDPALPLALEADQEGEQGDDEEGSGGSVDRGERGEQPEGREQEIDPFGEPEVGRRLARRHAQRHADTRDVDQVVDQELRAERDCVDREVLPARYLRARRHDDHRRGDGEPRVGDTVERPPWIGTLAQHAPRGAEGERRCHQQWDVGRGQEQQHRHEHELGGDRGGRPHAELDAGRQRQRGDERERQLG
jgi:hypothetical protein